MWTYVGHADNNSIVAFISHKVFVEFAYKYMYAERFCESSRQETPTMDGLIVTLGLLFHRYGFYARRLGILVSPILPKL